MLRSILPLFLLTTTPLFAGNWVGGVSTAWNTPANWDNNAVPAGFGSGAGVSNVNTTGPNIATISANVPDLFILQTGVGGGTGIINQTGGQVNNEIFGVGITGAASKGTYNLTGGTVNIADATGNGVGGLANLAQPSGGTGALNVTNGTVQTATNVPFTIGANGGNGTVTVNSGGLLASGAALNVGAIGSGADVAGSGTLNINTGGSVTVAVPANVEIGNGVGTVGAIKVSGGTLTAGGTFFDVGDNGGNGTLTITAGTVNHNGLLLIPGFNFGTGTINVSGGALNAQNLLVGNGGTGTLTLSGTGTVSVPAITLGVNAAVSVLNLNGGTLITSGLSGAGAVHFDGGTLKAGGAGASFLAGTTTDLKAGGAIIDTNGFDTTISAALTDGGGGGGLTKIGAGALTLAGTNTFTGPLTVNAGSLRLVGGTLPSGLKIMPLGDSITYGANGNNAGYRGPLYLALSPLAPGMLYVGSDMLNPGSLPANEQMHEGHGGYRIDQINFDLDGNNGIQTSNGGYWFPGGNGTGRAPCVPDIILLMIGTNDVYQNYLWSAVQSRLSDLVLKIVTQRPNAYLIMAQITPLYANQLNPYDPTTDNQVVTYNAIVAAVAAQYAGQGYHVSLVDMHTNFPADGLSSDHVHPNDTGFSFITSQWFNAITTLYAAGATSTAIPPGAALTVGGSGSVMLNGTFATSGALGGSGSVTNTASGGLTIDSANSATYTGNLSGGQLVKKGTGTETLTGVNTVTSLTVTAGTLALTGGTTTVSGNLSNNGTLRLTGAAALNVTGTFTNNGTLDLMTWSGQLPAGFVNNGTLLDRRAVKVDSESLDGSTNLFSLKITAYPGHGYQLQSAPTLTQSTTWTNVGQPANGTGSQITLSDPTPASGTTPRFYRVLVSP